MHAMNYPPMNVVESADRVQLGKWLRFLPIPGVGHIGTSNFGQMWRHETRVLDRIAERFLQTGGMTAEVSQMIGVEAMC
jgi:hypothetical protein